MDGLLSRFTVVAHCPTIVRIKGFSKELKLHHPPAQVWLLAVLQDRVKCVQVFLLSDTGATSLADEVIIEFPVRVCIVKDAFGFLLVSARSTALLNVAFQTFWH